MKKNKGLKLTLIILFIILLSMISFVGVYVQNKGIMKNMLPEYILSRDLKGYRRIELKVSEDIKETIKYDAEGNVIPEGNTETAVARTEEKKVNEADVLTKENYEQSKKVIEKRLNGLQVNDYIIRQNEENGSIILEVPEDKNTDMIVGQLAIQGKFEVVDNDTKEVLMTNDDVKYVKAGYGVANSGESAVFINIQFNKEGKEKFKNITNTYVEIKKENTDVANEVEEEHVHEEGEEHTHEEEEKTVKEIALLIDGTTLLTTYFDREISNGLLQLTVGAASKNNAEEMQDTLSEATKIASLIDSGKMSVVYTNTQNKFIYSDITENQIEKVIIIAIVVLTLAMVYLIIKYKAKGILGSVSLVGYVAVLLIALRYFNVQISIAGIVEIILSIMLNYCILASILKNKEIYEVIKKYLVILIPVIIISIVFTFMEIGMGVVLFWGIVIGLIYQLTMTNIMLKD